MAKPVLVVILRSLPLAMLAVVAGCPKPGSPSPPGDTTPPAGSVTINGDDPYAASTKVTLALTASDDGPGGIRMMVANDAAFSGSSWQPFVDVLDDAH